MKLLKLSLPVFFLFSFWGCGVHQGVTPESDAGTGSLTIEEGSGKEVSVLLNGRLLSEKTPLILSSLQEGEYDVVLLAPGLLQKEKHQVKIAASQHEKVKISLSPAATASLEIKSTPTGLSAYWDGRLLGETPLMLDGVSAGNYNLEVFGGNWYGKETIELEGNRSVEIAAQAQQSLLVEYFSNTSCVTCPTVDALLNKILDEAQDPRQQRIAWHAHYPSKQDPIFLALKEPQKIRHDLYSPKALPALRLNSREVNVMEASGMEERVRAAVSEGLDREISCALHVKNQMVSGEEWSGELEVKALQSLSGGEGHLVVREHLWDAMTPPGSNGQSEFHDIPRAKVTFNGSFGANMKEGQTERLSYTFSLKELDRYALSGYDLVFWIETKTPKQTVLCSGISSPIGF